MPLVAAVLVVSTLLHAGVLSFESALTHAYLSFAAPSPISEAVRVVFEPDREKAAGTDRHTRWVAAHTDTILWSGHGHLVIEGEPGRVSRVDLPDPPRSSAGGQVVPVSTIDVRGILSPTVVAGGGQLWMAAGVDGVLPLLAAGR